MKLSHQEQQLLLHKGKEHVAFRVMSHCISGQEYAHIRIGLVYVTDFKREDHSSFEFYDNYFDQKNKFKDIEIHAQMCTQYDSPYGWEIGFDTENGNRILTVDKLDEVQKTLKKIARKLRKIEETEGYIKDYVDFVMRIAQAVGVKSFYYDSAEHVQSTVYKRIDNVNELPNTLESIISSNATALTPKFAA